jgi:putative Mn2+ efflux pump MntP
MDIKSKKYLLVVLLTFIILFLMNYLGSTYPDRISRALLTAIAGVIGLTIGMWYINRTSKNDTFQDFD